MKALPVPLWPHRHETPMSFFSRVAAVNGADSLNELCRHVGVPYEFLARGESTAVATMAALSRVPALDLQRRCVIASGGRQTVNGQRVTAVSDGLRRYLRVCPKCICNDLATEGCRPRAKAWIRLPWLVDCVRTCHVHRVPLVPIGRRHEAGDIALIVRRSSSEIAALASASQEQPPSNFDAYLYNRLCGDDSDGSFLADLPFYVAVELTKMIGATQIHGDLFIPDYLTNSEWSAAGAAGFEITRHGAQAVTDFLSAMAKRSRRRGTSRNGPDALFGTLYEWLYNDPENLDYEPIRNLMRIVGNA